MTNCSNSGSTPSGSRRSRTAPTRCSARAAHKTANPSIVGRRAARAREAVRAADRLGRRPPADACPSSRLTIVGEGPKRDAAARPRGAARDAGDWIRSPAGSTMHDLVALYRRVVDRRQRLAGRGLGPEPHRGRRLRHTGGGHRHQRASQQRRRRRDRHPGAARPARRRNRHVLLDDGLRLRLGQAALERARTLTWDASALGTIQVLHRAVPADRPE